MRMVVFSAVLLMLASGAQAQDARSLDDFESTDGWKVVASDQVGGALRVVDGAEGRAVCLDYDFHGVSGYVGLQKRMPLDYPENYAFEYRMRGEGPPNDLQFKLVDASGDNVWWVRTPMFEPPGDWQPVQLRKRHVSMAWGPSEDKTLRRGDVVVTPDGFLVYRGGSGAHTRDNFEPLTKARDELANLERASRNPGAAYAPVAVADAAPAVAKASPRKPKPQSKAAAPKTIEPKTVEPKDFEAKVSE